MIVYYGVPDNLDYWADEPEKLVKYRNHLLWGDREPNESLNKCPSFNDYFKNTFIITFPYDYSYTWTDEGIFTKDYDQSFFNNTLEVRDGKKGFLGIVNPRYYFFSEQDVTMELAPAAYHHNDFTKNVTFVGGSFNISKHFRFLEHSHIFKRKDTTVKLKRGDAISYVRFLTDEKVTLKRFRVTTEMISMSQQFLSIRNFTNKAPFISRPISFFYNIFEKNNLKNFYLKQIKENLME